MHNQQEAVVASSIRGKAGWGQGKNLPCLDNSPFVHFAGSKTGSGNRASGTSIRQRTDDGGQKVTLCPPNNRQPPDTATNTFEATSL